MQSGSTGNAGDRKHQESNNPSGTKGRRGLAQGLNILAIHAAKMSQPAPSSGGARASSPVSVESNRSGRSVVDIMKDIRSLAQARTSGSPAGSVVIPSFSDVPEKVFTAEDIEAYTKAVRQKLRLGDLSSSSPGSAVIPSHGKSPSISRERAQLRDRITVDYYRERDQELAALGDGDDGDEEDDGEKEELPQAHSSSSSSSSSLLSGLQRGARSQPIDYDEDADLMEGDNDGGGFLSGKEFNGSMQNKKTELLATIGKLRSHIGSLQAPTESSATKVMRKLQRERDLILADSLEMAREIERLKAEAAKRSQQSKHSPPKDAAGRMPEGTSRKLHAAAGAGGGDDDGDDSSVFSGVSRHSARGALGRQLGAFARDGPPGIRSIVRGDGMSQLSSGSTDDSDRRVELFSRIFNQTRASRNSKVMSDHQYDTMIRQEGGYLIPSLDGTVYSRIYPKAGADKDRLHCLPPVYSPLVSSFDGTVSYLRANPIPHGCVGSLLEMIREEMKAYRDSVRHDLRVNGAETPFETEHSKLLDEALQLYYKKVEAAANQMGIGSKGSRHPHFVTRTFAFLKWHEQRWRKFIVENIYLLPFDLDEAGQRKLESTANWINENFDDSLRNGPITEQIEPVTPPQLMLALRVLHYCCEYCGALGGPASVCRTKACLEVNDSKSLLVTWTASKDKALAKAVADNAKISGSTPLTNPQKAAAVNAWVASSPANAKPVASTPVTMASLCENQHLIRAPIVTVLNF